VKKTNKPRLHFGLVVPSLDNAEKYNLLQDIEDYAKKHDIHLTAYFGTNATKNYSFASHYVPCFEAIKRSAELDGVIIFSGFIATNIGTDALIAYVNSILGRIPVISIGLPIPGAYCVIADNMSGMYSAVNHLIQENGKKRIAFIKGPDGHPEAEARLAGYLKALSDNGIARDDNLILPGNFLPNCGISAIEELLDKRKVPFDAISCCNDDSALGAMRELKMRGYSLPKDIAVTGFDDQKEAAEFKPALSTVRQDVSKLGLIAGDALSRVICGEHIDEVIYVVPELIIRRSCGCNKKERRKTSHQDSVESRERRRRMVTDNLLLEFNLESLGKLMRESLPIIEIDFAIVGVYRAPIEGADGDRSINRLFGFDAERMINVDCADEMPFPFSDCSAIKGIDFERKRHTLFFLPLFFGNEERGSSLIEYNDYNPINWYESLRTNISAAVKGANLIEKIQTLSVTDELTGLLNRRGFFQQLQARLLYLQRNPDQIPVVLGMDMDGLKYINDTYGHAEGDAAISAFVDILKASVRSEDIIARFGGDEFVLFSVIKSESDIGKLESRIRQKLNEYNAQKNHPYDVIGSIGAAILDKPTNAAFEQAMLDADNILYCEKQKKRKKGLSRS